MSVFPDTMSAPSDSSTRSASIVPLGSGPLRTRSPATSTASGFARRISAVTASSAIRLPWMSERTAMRVIRRTPAGGMMNESRPSQATSPSTLATPRPLPNREPSFSIVISSRSVSPGTTTRLKRTSSIPANSPIRSPKPGCIAT